MNNQRNLKTATCAAILLMLVIGIAVPAAAQTGWTLTATTDKNSYAQGNLVTVSGSIANAGVAQPNILVSVQVTDSAGTLQYSTIATSGATGAYSTQFRISAIWPNGTYTIAAAAGQGGAQVATTVNSFTVSGTSTGATAILTLTPTNAAPGATVAFTGSAFTPSQTLGLTVNWGGIAISLVNSTASATGTASGSFVVPAIQSQVYTVTAADGAGINAIALLGVKQTDAATITAALNSGLANVQGNITATLTALNAQIASVTGPIATLNTAVGQIQTSLSSLGGTVTSIQGSIATVSTSLGSVTTNVNALSPRIKGLEDVLAIIYTDLGTVKTSVAAINPVVTDLKGTLATVSTTVGTIQGTITSISGNVATIQTDVGTIKADASTIKSQTANISTDVANQVSGIANQVSSINTLVIVAIVLALVAAIAAIASIVMMRRKIAG